MSERFYAWLLRLFPARFRQDYGVSALQLFCDRLQAERGFYRRLRFWLDIFTDLAASIPREHWRQNRAASATAFTHRGTLAQAISMGLFVLLGWSTGCLGNASPMLLFAACAPLAIVALWQFRSIRRPENYRLSLPPDCLELKYNGNHLTVLKSQIVRINEDQHGLLLISHSGTISSIWIPADVNGYWQIRNHLSQWVDRIHQRRSLWLNNPKPAFFCAVSLLPAMLLVRADPWFLVIAAIYYGMLLLAIAMPVLRPPRDSGLTPSRRGLNLPSPAYMWCRFKNSCRNRMILGLFLLPVVRIILPR